MEDVLRHNKHIRCLIINDPTNPSGIKYTVQELQGIADVLDKEEFKHISTTPLSSRHLSHLLVVICDEPYGELVFTENSKRFLEVVCFVVLISPSVSFSSSHSLSCSAPLPTSSSVLICCFRPHTSRIEPVSCFHWQKLSRDPLACAAVLSTPQMWKLMARLISLPKFREYSLSQLLDRLSCK